MVLANLPNGTRIIIWAIKEKRKKSIFPFFIDYKTQIKSMLLILSELIELFSKTDFNYIFFTTRKSINSLKNFLNYSLLTPNF